MRSTLALAATVAVALAAGQAQAHARLIQSTPKAGATVAAPQALHLLYSEGIVTAASSVTVAGPGGAAAPTGPLALDPKSKRTVIVPVTGKLAAGPYKVHWTMKTEDGHTTDGDFGFKVK